MPSLSLVRSPLVAAGTAAFRLASRARGERAIHGRGRTLTGRLTVTGGLGTGARLLDAPGSYDVLVRFSRSAGLPELPGQGSAALRDLPDEVGVELLVATPHGSWRPWGVVRTTGPLPAPGGRQTRFNPWTTGGGIRPSGPWQQWRRESYDASHVAPDED